MNHAYIRISCDKSTVENQEFQINNYCKANNIVIDNWIEETVTGVKDPHKRKLGTLLDIVQPGDTIICADLSRLGRSLFMVMEILSDCLSKGVTIIAIKENFTLQDDIQTKVLSFAFGLAAEIERNMISERTKQALNRKKAEGIKLGRPQGSKNKHTKLSGKQDTIIELLNQHQTYTSIAKIFHVDRTTLMRFVKNEGIYRPIHCNKNQPFQSPIAEYNTLNATKL